MQVAGDLRPLFTFSPELAFTRQVQATGPSIRSIYTMNCRGREIGIRLPIGAQVHEVRRLVMFEGSAMVAIGLVLGLDGALVARLLQSFL